MSVLPVGVLSNFKAGAFAALTRNRHLSQGYSVWSTSDVSGTLKSDVHSNQTGFDLYMMTK
jgi:hypothetical protein